MFDRVGRPYDSGPMPLLGIGVAVANVALVSTRGPRATEAARLRALGPATTKAIMMNRQFRRALVAAVSGVTLALAACGVGQQSDSGDGGGASAPSSAVPSAGTPSAGTPGAGATSPSSVAKNPADIMFVVMMIPHHEQAVEMSDLLLAKSGVDADVRKLAEQIKAAQQPEIDQMKGWLADWGIDDSRMNTMDHSGHMGGMLSKKQLEKLRKADGPTGQKLYLEGMIEHHQGAIDMANNVLGVGQDPDVKKLAEAIVVSQQAEIVEMTKMLGR